MYDNLKEVKPNFSKLQYKIPHIFIFTRKILYEYNMIYLSLMFMIV